MAAFENRSAAAIWAVSTGSAKSGRSQPGMGQIRTHRGALAQLGEHLLCKQGVIGSIPIGSTKRQQDISPGMKTAVPLREQRYMRGFDPCFFDIVNGFLIDAVAHRAHASGRKLGMWWHDCGTIQM